MKCLPFLIALTIISTVELASFTGCEDFGGLPPRIILNPGPPSIDGIHLGDSPEQVQRALGPPERIGWADGIEKTWRTYGYGYDPEMHVAALNIWFIRTPQVEWGPADLVIAKGRYAGKTLDDIGIGTGRERVRAMFGPPILVTGLDSLGGSHEYYCFTRWNVLFGFDRDTISAITLGPLVPESTIPSCE